MSLFDQDLAHGHQWGRVGDSYEVTKKPRGLDLSPMPTVPFATMEAIPQGGAYAPSYTLKAPQDIRSGTYFERGDILVAKITPSFENGKQALVTDLPAPLGFATTEVIPLRPRDVKHDRRLLFFYLLHPDVRHHVAERMEGSTGRQRVPAEVLLDLPYPALPPEDQVIAANILESLLRIKSIAEQSIVTAQSLKRAAMHALFTRGLRGEAQKETEIGSVPESWEVVEFSSLRDRLQYGTSTRCTPEPSTYPVLRIPNVAPQQISRSDLKYCDLPPSSAERFLLEIGDLLFIRTNGVLDRLGACAVYSGQPPNALFASYLIRASLKIDSAMPRFASYFLSSDRGTSMVAERAVAASDGKFNLNTAAIDSFLVPLPPLDQQREIVATLEAIDQKADLHLRKRGVLEELFEALLHKLMTGEIRVHDLVAVGMAPDGAGLGTAESVKDSE